MEKIRSTPKILTLFKWSLSKNVFCQFSELYSQRTTLFIAADEIQLSNW